jgi:hypothetical protein
MNNNVPCGVESDDNAIDVEKLEIIVNSKTRLILTISIFALCAVFISGSAIYGMIKGDFSALQTVMTYVQVPLGALIGFYFRDKQNE